MNCFYKRHLRDKSFRTQTPGVLRSLLSRLYAVLLFFSFSWFFLLSRALSRVVPGEARSSRRPLSPKLPWLCAFSEMGLHLRVTKEQRAVAKPFHGRVAPSRPVMQAPAGNHPGSISAGRDSWRLRQPIASHSYALACGEIN